jgi:hypothetical protein
MALLVCDKVETPTWKNIDLLGSFDAQDGWLIQGYIYPTAVTDPMFLLVTNIPPQVNAFFRAIPYSGPQVTLTGANPNDTGWGDRGNLTGGFPEGIGRTPHSDSLRWGRIARRPSHC